MHQSSHLYSAASPRTSAGKLTSGCASSSRTLLSEQPQRCLMPKQESLRELLQTPDPRFALIFSFDVLRCRSGGRNGW